MEGEISEAEFLERRINEVKPHMENLHAWLLEKKQKEMILDSSKTKESVNYCIETAKQNGIAPEDYLRCLFEKVPYAETENDWEKLLPWNIEITPYKIRGEWI